METLIRHRKRLAVLIGIFALQPAWWISAPIRGYAVACFDVMRGGWHWRRLWAASVCSMEEGRAIAG